jgi:hypothetical protein
MQDERQVRRHSSIGASEEPESRPRRRAFQTANAFRSETFFAAGTDDFLGNAAIATGPDLASCMGSDSTGWLP